MSTPDPAMRAGDSDRDAVIEVLGEAFADGRLDYEEFSHRHDRAVLARTLGELQPLVRDLGRVDQPDTRVVVTAALGRQRRSGPWLVPERMVVTAAIADVTLDFTHATCPHREVRVQVRPGLGRVRLIVPRGWGARTDEVRAGWGSVSNDLPADPTQDRPLLVVSGVLGVGRLVVRRPRFSWR